jgi:hypothetical protein
VALSTSFLLLLFLAQVLSLFYIRRFGKANKHNTSAIMMIKGGVFGHTSVGGNQKDGSSSNITSLFILFNIILVVLLILSLQKYFLDLINPPINILLLKPFLPKPIQNSHRWEINNNSITYYLTNIIEKYTISF